MCGAKAAPYSERACKENKISFIFVSKFDHGGFGFFPKQAKCGIFMTSARHTKNILGIDPGLRRCGWGLVQVQGNHLTYLAHGVVAPSPKQTLGERLVGLEQGLDDIMDTHLIDAVAVEQTFQNTNPQATLALGMARGVCLLVPTRRGLEVQDYAPNTVKKALVGKGHADKAQVAMMVSRLLGGLQLKASDETDALALAICHAHYAQSTAAMNL